jgi:hypothetical protein
MAWSEGSNRGHRFVLAAGARFRAQNRAKTLCVDRPTGGKKIEEEGHQ